MAVVGGLGPYGQALAKRKKFWLNARPWGPVGSRDIVFVTGWYPGV